MDRRKPTRSLAIAILTAACALGVISLLGLAPLVDASKARLLHFPGLILSVFLVGAALALWKIEPGA